MFAAAGKPIRGFATAAALRLDLSIALDSRSSRPWLLTGAALRLRPHDRGATRGFARKPVGATADRARWL